MKKWKHCIRKDSLLKCRELQVNEKVVEGIDGFIHCNSDSHILIEDNGHIFVVEKSYFRDNYKMLLPENDYKRKMFEYMSKTASSLKGNVAFVF